MSNKNDKKDFFIIRCIKFPLTFPPRSWLQGFMLWLGILSISVTMNADNFEQREASLFAFPIVALERVLGRKPERVELATLVANTTPEIPRIPDLYILICDISRSLDKVMDKSEVNRYLKRVEPDRLEELSKLGIKQDEGAQAFNLALAELVRYVHQIPKQSMVALWTFGKKAHPVVPASGAKADPDYYTLGDYQMDNTTTYKHLGQEIANLLLEYSQHAGKELKDIQSLSDFENLFTELLKAYEDEIEGPMAVHFIIVSDFDHDIGPKSMDDEIWSSKYRASNSIIREKFNQMARKGTTFHFSKMIGATTEKHSVLSIATNYLEWSSFRETDHYSSESGRNFDFMNGFIEVNEPLYFNYTPGSNKISATLLEIANPPGSKNRLRISLAAVNGRDHGTPLKLDVQNTGLTTEKPELLKLGTSYNCDLGQQVSTISLTPRFVLSQAEIDDYRLLISPETFVDSNNNPVTNQTIAVRLAFHKDLSYSGAWSMLICLTLLCFSGTYGIIRMSQDLRAKDGSTPKSPLNAVHGFPEENISHD